MTEDTNRVIMGSMKRIDVLKGIEKILVDKAYETGHISHRADGDWQKQADGSWTPYTGQSTQSTSQTQESAPTQNFSDLDKYIAKLPNTDLTEDSDEVTNVVSEYLADHGIDDNDDDFIAVRNAIMEKLNGDRYGEITEEDLEEDAPDGEDDWDIENKLDEYRSSHPRPVLSNDGHSKGLTSEKDQFEDELERFRQLTDPYDDERLTADEAYKQMQEEHEELKKHSDIMTPAINSGHEKFMKWISDFAGVEKSAFRDMRSAPTTKNMGF